MVTIVFPFCLSCSALGGCGRERQECTLLRPGPTEMPPNIYSEVTLYLDEKKSYQSCLVLIPPSSLAVKVTIKNDIIRLVSIYSPGKAKMPQTPMTHRSQGLSIDWGLPPSWTSVSVLTGSSCEGGSHR